jgi:hypothetical protein
MRHFRLKMFLLAKGVPDTEDTRQLGELFDRFGMASRFQAVRMVGLPWGDAASKWLQELRNEAISEFTLIGTLVAMLAAIVAAVAAVL